MSQDHIHSNAFSIHAIQEETALQMRFEEHSLVGRQDLNNHMLRWLLHYPLQRIEDLALGVQTLEQTIRRHLLTLSETGLVEQVLFSRSGWFYLTERGICAAAACEGLDPQEAARRWQADERGLLRLFPRFPMLFCAQNWVNDLIQGAPTSLAFQGRRAMIRWCWRRAYTFTFHSNKRRLVRCTADAAVVLRRSAPREQHTFHPDDDYTVLLLYFDLGEASGWDRASMMTKLRRLLLYRESQERQPYRSMFPLVVIFVTSERQEAYWHEAEQEAARSLRLGTPLAAVIVNLAAEKRKPSDPSISRSCWHADWRDLRTHQPCRLQEKLPWMTLAAIPAGLLPQRRDPDRAVQTTGKQKSATRHTHLVKGNFGRRLSNLVLRPVSAAKEREVVCLLGLMMGQRLCTVVQMVFAHPLTTTEELGWFLDLSASSVGRYLWTLEQWHCIEAVTAKRKDETKETRWKLSARGLRYLAASESLPRSEIFQSTKDGRSWQQGVYLLQKYLGHTAGVYWLLTMIHQAVRSEPGHQIVWFASHMQCAERYSYRGAWYNFRPDAMVLYQWSTQERCQRWQIWIEWDQGTMGIDQLRKKIASYAHYMRSRQWRRYGKQSGEPLLAIIVPDRGRADRMLALAQELLVGTDVQVSVTLRSLLIEQGFLAPIWFQAVPVPSQKTSLSALFSLGEQR